MRVPWGPEDRTESGQITILSKLDFPEIRGFPFQKATFFGEIGRWFSVAFNFDHD